MNKRTDPQAGIADPVGHSVAVPREIDTSDLPDSSPGTTLGTLRDAIDRATARRKLNGADAPPRG